MKTIISVIIVFTILYIIKVPGVVVFVDNLLTPLRSVLYYIIDVLTHVRERHPYIYMLLFFILLFLMRPEYERIQND